MQVRHIHASNAERWAIQRTLDDVRGMLQSNGAWYARTIDPLAVPMHTALVRDLVPAFLREYRVRAERSKAEKRQAKRLKENTRRAQVLAKLLAMAPIVPEPYARLRITANAVELATDDPEEAPQSYHVDLIQGCYMHDEMAEPLPVEQGRAPPGSLRALAALALAKLFPSMTPTSQRIVVSTLWSPNSLLAAPPPRRVAKRKAEEAPEGEEERAGGPLWE